MASFLLTEIGGSLAPFNGCFFVAQIYIINTDCNCENENLEKVLRGRKMAAGRPRAIVVSVYGKFYC